MHKEISDWDHLDFIWATNAKEAVYDDIVSMIQHDSGFVKPHGVCLCVPARKHTYIPYLCALSNKCTRITYKHTRTHNACSHTHTHTRTRTDRSHTVRTHAQGTPTYTLHTHTHMYANTNTPTHPHTQHTEPGSTPTRHTTTGAWGHYAILPFPIVVVFALLLVMCRWSMMFPAYRRSYGYVRLE